MTSRSRRWCRPVGGAGGLQPTVALTHRPFTPRSTTGAATAARHHHSRLRADTYVLLCIRVRAGVRQKLRHRAAVDFGHGDDGRFKHGVTQRGVAKLPSQSRGHRHTRRDTPTRTSTIRPTASFPLALGSCQRRQRAPCPARSGRRRRTTGSGRRPRDRATLRCAAGSTHAGSTKRQPHTTIKRCSNRQAKTDVSGTRVWWPSTSGRPPSIAEGRPPPPVRLYQRPTRTGGATPRASLGRSCSSATTCSILPVRHASMISCTQVPPTTPAPNAHALARKWRIAEAPQASLGRAERTRTA